jgi:heme o synthase
MKNLQLIKDLIEITKARITFSCVLMALGGLALSPQQISLQLFSFLVTGVWLSCACANALNMVWERKSDLLMERTKNRPIASGRISVQLALFYSLFLGLISFIILFQFVNPLTAYLSLASQFLYVCVYTPLKKISTISLLVGAVPGAVPPLLGWTASTNTLSAGGWVLFFVVFLWQIPHFIAISFRNKEDYVKAGIKILPVEHGKLLSQLEAAAYAVIMIPVSLALVPLKIAGSFYFFSALVLGVCFFVCCVVGIFSNQREMLSQWSKRVFFGSLLYLPLLTLALTFDLAFH